MVAHRTLPDRKKQVPTEKVDVGMASSRIARVSRDKSHIGLEQWCSALGTSRLLRARYVFLAS